MVLKQLLSDRQNISCSTVSDGQTYPGVDTTGGVKCLLEPSSTGAVVSAVASAPFLARVSAAGALV